MEDRTQAQTEEERDPKIVAALFFEDGRVNAAVQELTECGFDPNSIEVRSKGLVPPEQDEPNEDPIASGAAIGVVSGGVVGGVFGLLLGVGTVLPEAAAVVGGLALSGIGIGIVAGGAVGVAIGVRISRQLAKHPHSVPYEGGILIAVDAPDRQQDAMTVLIHHGGDLGPTIIAEAMESENARAAYLL
jgi:hypothetical protein